MTTTRYLWNPINQNIIREYDGAGNTVSSYTTEPDLYGDVVSQHRDGQDSYYHTDGQGSTLALTDANGDVTDTYAYSAFGEVTAHAGGTVNPFQYIGQEGYYFDGETGEYDSRQRPYQALRGNWLTIEPSPDDGAVNLYLYCNNSPTNFTDPSGLRPVCCSLTYKGWYDNWDIDCPSGLSAFECCNRYKSRDVIEKIGFGEGSCPKKRVNKPLPPDDSDGSWWAIGILAPKVAPAPPAVVAGPLAGLVTFFSANTCQAPGPTPTPQPLPQPKPIKLPPLWPKDPPRSEDRDPCLLGENEKHCGQLKCIKNDLVAGCVWKHGTYYPPAWPDEPEREGGVCRCPIFSF